MAQAQPAWDWEGRDPFFAKLYERILGLATYFGCGDHARDVAQETMAVLVERYSAVKAPEDLIKLANAICFKISRGVLRRQYRGPVYTELDVHVSGGPSPEVLTCDHETRTKLMECLGRCSKRCKALFILDLDEADTERICRELNLSRSAVFTLRNRCLSELSELWRGRK